jgi:hypothetical protein
MQTFRFKGKYSWVRIAYECPLVALDLLDFPPIGKTIAAVKEERQ